MLNCTVKNGNLVIHLSEATDSPALSDSPWSTLVNVYVTYKAPHQKVEITQNFQFLSTKALKFFVTQL